MTNSIRAIAASQHRSGGLRPEPATPSQPFRRSSHIAASNDTARTPYGDQCRKRDAIQAVRERYWSLRNRLAARMEREIARIEREGM